MSELLNYAREAVQVLSGILRRHDLNHLRFRLSRGSVATSSLMLIDCLDAKDQQVFDDDLLEEIELAISRELRQVMPKDNPICGYYHCHRGATPPQEMTDNLSQRLRHNTGHGQGTYRLILATEDAAGPFDHADYLITSH